MLKKLTIDEFNEFQKHHIESNYYQTISYAMLMAEVDYDYDLIGLIDYEGNILAGAMILIKQIGSNTYYGYSPRGFLIDYTNKELLYNFTEEIKEYYKDKSVAFIKVNPLLPIGKLNKNLEIDYNSNRNILNDLTTLGYKKLRDNLYFEAQLPRFNAIINLKEYKKDNLDKNTKNKIKKGIRKGLKIEKVDKSKIDIFYEFIKNKKDRNSYYYKDYYTVFEKSDNVDLFLIKIDYNEFLLNSQFIYNEELEKNTKLNEKLTTNHSNRLINHKMNSDKKLLSYKNDIMEATKGLQENKTTYVAGALVIKHNKTATIAISGYDTSLKRFAPNYFLHYSLIKYYKDNYDYLDLNGVVGDFKNENSYSGLNRFKLSFNPSVYEYIGELDLVINENIYNILLKTGTLAHELNKKPKEIKK